jgi:hypothetical protein
MLELKKTVVFAQWFFRVKTIAYESAILFFLTVLFIFASNKNNGFSDTIYAEYLERALFGAIGIAILGELMVMIGTIATAIIEILRNLKDGKKKKLEIEEAKKKEAEEEANSRKESYRNDLEEHPRVNPENKPLDEFSALGTPMMSMDNTPRVSSKKDKASLFNKKKSFKDISISKKKSLFASESRHRPVRIAIGNPDEVEEEAV